MVFIYQDNNLFLWYFRSAEMSSTMSRLPTLRLTSFNENGLKITNFRTLNRSYVSTLLTEQNHSTNVHDRNFMEEFEKQRIKLSRFQRVFLSVGSSLAAILNPAR